MSTYTARRTGRTVITVFNEAGERVGKRSSDCDYSHLVVASDGHVWSAHYTPERARERVSADRHLAHGLHVLKVEDREAFKTVQPGERSYRPQPAQPSHGWQVGQVVTVREPNRSYEATVTEIIETTSSGNIVIEVRDNERGVTRTLIRPPRR